MIKQQGRTIGSEVRPWTGLRTPPPNGNGAAVNTGCAPATTTCGKLSRRRSRGQGQTTGRGKANPVFFSARVLIDTNHKTQRSLHMHRVLLRRSNGASARCLMQQRKPTGGRALKGVTTAISPSVLALRSEQWRTSSLATQQEKGHTTQSSARSKPGEGCQQGAHHTSTQHRALTSTQQQLAPMWRWSGELRQEGGAANHGIWPTQEHPLQHFPLRTHQHLATPATPGGTSPSPPFNLRHPPRHSTPTTARGPTTTARRNRPPLPNNRHHPPQRNTHSRGIKESIGCTRQRED